MFHFLTEIGIIFYVFFAWPVIFGHLIPAKIDKIDMGLWSSLSTDLLKRNQVKIFIFSLKNEIPVKAVYENLLRIRLLTLKRCYK